MRGRAAIAHMAHALHAHPERNVVSITEPDAHPARKPADMSEPKRKSARSPAPTLSISSRNYSSWSLRGWLLVRFAGLDTDVQVIPPDDQSRQELLLLSPSILVP